MRNDDNTGSDRSFLGHVKAYFGIAEPGLTWGQRCRIFAENERRSWARLMGSRRAEDACRRNSTDAHSHRR